MENSENRTIRFEMEKSNHFRVIYASGAMGGFTPREDAFGISFYNERHPIPKSIEYEYDEDGKQVNQEIAGRACIFREIECTVMMNKRTAEDLYIWLRNHFGDKDGSE